jgi:hypothetical protein
MGISGRGGATQLIGTVEDGLVISPSDIVILPGEQDFCVSFCFHGYRLESRQVPGLG